MKAADFSIPTDWEPPIEPESPPFQPRPPFERATSIENLNRAWERVARNNGAPGGDGVSVAELRPQIFPVLHGLSKSLRERRYIPSPVLRVEIPKASGGSRKLGIPTVIDRIVQQAVAQTLQTILEPTFSPGSFAYRPARSPIQAVRHIGSRLSSKGGWVLHFDVQDFFDSVPHDAVLEAVASRVDDQNLLELIHSTMRSGMLLQGHVEPTVVGIPQGSPLSPILANAVLDRLDRWLESHGAVFARYADDCAVLVDSAAEGERLRGAIDGFLRTLRLRLNASKTKLTPAQQAEFLGFSFLPGRDRRMRMIIGDESRKDFTAELDRRLSAAAAATFEERTRLAQSLLQSWLNYFGATEEPEQVILIRNEIDQRLRIHEWDRWANAAARRRNLVARGIPPELAEVASQPNVSQEFISRILAQALPLSRGTGDPDLLPSNRQRNSCSVNYAGRIQRGAANITTDPAASWQGERSWCLIDRHWFAVTIHFTRLPGALLRRPVSVSIECCKQTLVLVLRDPPLSWPS